MIKNRYLSQQIQQDLAHKMVFVGGPRQVGKTTLAQSELCKDQNNYFNWDNPKTRQAYLKNPDFFSELEPKIRTHRDRWVCFDEIHKRPKWKNILK